MGPISGCVTDPVDLGHDDVAHASGSRSGGGRTDDASVPGPSANAGARTDLGDSAGSGTSQPQNAAVGVDASTASSTGGSGGFEHNGGSGGAVPSGGSAGMAPGGGVGGNGTGNDTPGGGTEGGGTEGGSTGGTEPSGGAGGAHPLACDAIPGPCTRVQYNHTATAESTTTTRYFYDAAGQLVREETDPDVVVRYAYDAAGRLLESRTDSCDVSSSPDCRWTIYTYDEQGNVVKRENRDMSPNAEVGCTYYSYGDAGEVLSSEYYRGCSDTLLYWSVSYEYDDNGRLVTEIHDDTQSSSKDHTVTYEYDAAGRLVSQQDEYTTAPDSGSSTVYEYDAAGYLSAERHFDAQGNATATVVYTRNAAGQPLTAEHQNAAANDYRIFLTYDDQGNELSRHVVYLEGPSAGVDAQCDASTYDACGHQLTRDYDVDCADPASYQTTWTYDCFE